MKKVRITNTMCMIACSLILFAHGCSSSNNSPKGYEEPYPEQDISGVWLGNIGKTFALGIITKEDDDEFSAWFVGQDEFSQFKQFISPDGSLLVQETDSAVFTGYLDDCSWNTAGLDYATKTPRSLFTLAAAAARASYGAPFGSYTYGDKSETGFLSFYYNTSFEVKPDVNNLSGQWVIKNAFVYGNTARLVISPSTQSTSGTTFTGDDDRGNTFDGSITIYYNPLYSKSPNVYTVNLILKNSSNSINLTGLAAYVLEAQTQGIQINRKTLAIGTASTGRSYFFGGFAEPQE